MIVRYVARGGILREGEKSRVHPVDLEPQTISEALLAARHTAEFQRRTLEYSWDLKTLKTEKWHNLFFAVGHLIFIGLASLEYLVFCSVITRHSTLYRFHN